MVAFCTCRCDGKYDLTVYEQGAKSPGRWKKEGLDQSIRYGHLSADHLDGDKVSYAEQASEIEGILEMEYKEKKLYANLLMPYYRIRQACGDVIFFRMTKAVVLQLKDDCNSFTITDVKVKFELKYSYFDRLHKAVDLLSESTIRRLFPSDASCFTFQKECPDLLLSPRFQQFLALDYNQIKAVEMIVSAEPNAPVIIAGSFGTGKTRMLAQAAFQIITKRHSEQPRVLLCAHHQASADAFLNNYFGPMKINEKWKVFMVRMVVHASDKDYYDRRYRKYCMVAHEVVKQLHNIQLVVTTFANTLHLVDQLGDSASHWFTHILIDEGAQTREPETIAPLFLCGPKTVVAIAGDHKQVSTDHKLCNC